MSNLNGIHRRVNAEGKLEIEFCRELWDTIKSFDISAPRVCGCVWNGICNKKAEYFKPDNNMSYKNNKMVGQWVCFDHYIGMTSNITSAIEKLTILQCEEEGDTSKRKIEKAVEKAIAEFEKNVFATRTFTHIQFFKNAGNVITEYLDKPEIKRCIINTWRYEMLLQHRFLIMKDNKFVHDFMKTPDFTKYGIWLIQKRAIEKGFKKYKKLNP